MATLKCVDVNGMMRMVFNHLVQISRDTGGGRKQALPTSPRLRRFVFHGTTELIIVIITINYIPRIKKYEEQGIGKKEGGDNSVSSYHFLSPKFL